MLINFISSYNFLNPYACYQEMLVNLVYTGGHFCYAMSCKKQVQLKFFIFLIPSQVCQSLILKRIFIKRKTSVIHPLKMFLIFCDMQEMCGYIRVFLKILYLLSIMNSFVLSTLTVISTIPYSSVATFFTQGWCQGYHDY